ncbi:MAG: patatin family protein [Solobacterium sp.]|nr:patatin family protein [Solobacterium sp.]
MEEKQKKRTALIMEGGAMRGLFTCGIIDVFLEQNITFDAAAGISAGAIFGINYKSRQIGRPLRYNLRFCRDPRYGTLTSFLKSGDLYDADFCYRVVPELLDVFDAEAYRKNPMKFYAGVTNAYTGKAEYRCCDEWNDYDAGWVQASGSMPVVSKPVQVGGKLLLDGGIADSVMFRYMEGLGYNRNVIILTRPAGYRKQNSRLLPLMKAALHDYPEVYEAMKRRPEIYNRQMEEIEEREKRGECLVMRPKEDLGVRRNEHDPKELQRVYDIGRNEALERLEEVRKFLNQSE